MGFKGLIISALGIFVLASTHSAMADPIDDAVAADRIGDFGAALDIIRPLVDQGDPTAQAILGEMYVNGHAGRVDFHEAERLMFQSVQKGDREGRAFLALMYKNGWGVQKDDLAAAYWSGSDLDHPISTQSPNITDLQPLASTEDSPFIKYFKAFVEMTKGMTRGELHQFTLYQLDVKNRKCASIFSPQAATTHLYRAPSGTLYKYDLNNSIDWERYDCDIDAQSQDGNNPQIKLDRSMRVYGGGALKQ